MKTGGCLCGAVRYEVEGEPVFTGLCHCRDCQKATGSGHVPAMAMPRSGVKITGETKGFSVVGDSKRTLTRNFCPTCGSLIFSESDGMPGLVLLTAGTLDDTSGFKPQVAIYTRSRPQWEHGGEGVPEFEGPPPPPPASGG
ncbi:MAG TPA: GFA family protein [Allosphingosinicella sp.]|jgi:hypothetical protein|nr:GFA family protein [Allosphingosinicella sp.]